MTFTTRVPSLRRRGGGAAFLLALNASEDARRPLPRAAPSPDARAARGAVKQVRAEGAMLRQLEQEKKDRELAEAHADRRRGSLKGEYEVFTSGDVDDAFTT